MQVQQEIIPHPGGVNISKSHHAELQHVINACAKFQYNHSQTIGVPDTKLVVFCTQTDTQAFLEDKLVGLISSCSYVNLITPQIPNPNPTKVHNCLNKLCLWNTYAPIMALFFLNNYDLDI